MKYNYKILFFLLFLAFGSNVFSQDTFENEIVRKLFGDIAYELDHFDGISYTEEQKGKFLSDMKAFERGELREIDFTKYEFLPDYLSNTKPFQEISDADMSFYQKSQVRKEPHSIQGKDGYLKNRLGENLFGVAKDGKLDLVVHAGFPQNLPNILNVSPDNLLKVPSLYEAWGIYKYIDISNIQTPGVHSSAHVSPLQNVRVEWSPSIFWVSFRLCCVCTLLS